MKYESHDEISHEWVVRQYFNRVKSGDLHGVLDLFSDDCVIYEPFSSSKFLTGKIEIEPFFRSAIMANQGVQYEIKIEKERHNTVGNSMVAVVVFRKDNEIKGKFTFDFKDVGEGEVESIRSLKIEFIET